MSSKTSKRIVFLGNESVGTKIIVQGKVIGWPGKEFQLAQMRWFVTKINGDYENKINKFSHVCEVINLKLRRIKNSCPSWWWVITKRLEIPRDSSRLRNSVQREQISNGNYKIRSDNVQPAKKSINAGGVSRTMRRMDPHRFTTEKLPVKPSC